jgi:hypothetical protein
MYEIHTFSCLGLAFQETKEHPYRFLDLQPWQDFWFACTLSLKSRSRPRRKNFKTCCNVPLARWVSQPDLTLPSLAHLLDWI